MGMEVPDTIIWIFTARCNLNCIHCYARRFLCECELSLEEKLKLIREMGELGVEYVGLSGGEPLVHRDLPVILRELYDRDIYVSLVTNGTTVTRDIARILSRYDVYVYVSIDGPRRIHDTIRGVGVFDKVVDGISVLRDCGVEYATVMAVGKYNYKFTGEYVELALSLGADHAAIIPVMPSGRARVSNVWVSASEYVEAIRDATSRAEELSYEVVFWCTPFLNVIVNSKYARTYYCRISDTMDISPSGRILLCDVLDLSITSIREVGLKNAIREYYSSSIISEITDPPNLPLKCIRCPIRSLCRGGCFARSYILYGDFNRGDPLCPIIACNGVDGIS